MTKERFDQLANAAEKIAKIEDQQELSDKAQHKEYERRLLDKDFIESLNPLAQENLRMAEELREEKKENGRFVASLLNEISLLTKQVEASKKLCQIYYDIAVEEAGERYVRMIRDAKIAKETKL